MSEVTVRTAVAGDLDGVVASCTALFAEDAGTRDPLRNQSWPATYGGEWAGGLMADPESLLLVATTDGVVGHLVGKFMPASEMWIAPRAELVSMYVRPEVRGGGVAGRLIDAFAAWAQERGAARLEVDAYASNATALRVYERNGFHPHSVQLIRSEQPAGSVQQFSRTPTD